MSSVITILTPTYNRESTLLRLYRSLLSQTCKDFEWVIVDDGSTDDTKQIINCLVDSVDRNFDITYIYQANGGKHRAINAGVKKANGDYVFIVDSDDYLTEDAIDCVIKWVESIDDIPSLAGVAGLKSYSNGAIVGESPSKTWVEASNIERKKFRLNGDKAEIYRTDILRKYPFPEVEGENFMTEAVVWDKIALSGYKLRWFDKAIYYCQYLEGGLSKTGDLKFINNIGGYGIYVKQKLIYAGVIEKIKAIGSYTYYAKMNSYSLRKCSSFLGYPVLFVFLAYIMKKYLPKSKEAI